MKLLTDPSQLFGSDSPIQAPTLLPPGTGLSRNGVISYHPVNDGPQPGSSRTRFQITSPGETPQDSPIRDAPLTSSPPRVTLDASALQPVTAMGDPTGNPEPITPSHAFTRDDELDLLFDPKRIPMGMREAVGSDLHVNICLS